MKPKHTSSIMLLEKLAMDINFDEFNYRRKLLKAQEQETQSE